MMADHCWETIDTRGTGHEGPYGDLYRYSEHDECIVEIYVELHVDEVAEGITFYQSHKECCVRVQGSQIVLSGWRAANELETEWCNRSREDQSKRWKAAKKEEIERARRLLASVKTPE